MSLSKKQKKLALILFHDEYNSCALVTELIANILSYEGTQAESCANTIYNRGFCIVKSFVSNQRAEAESIRDIFIKSGIQASIQLY